MPYTIEEMKDFIEGKIIGSEELWMPQTEREKIIYEKGYNDALNYISAQITKAFNL